MIRLVNILKLHNDNKLVLKVVIGNRKKTSNQFQNNLYKGFLG